MEIGIRIAFVLLLVIATAGLTNYAWAWVTSPCRVNHNTLISSTVVQRRPASASAPLSTIWSLNKLQHENVGNSCLHSSAVSPRRADLGGGIDDDEEKRGDIGCESENREEELLKQQEKLTLVSKLLQAEPRDLLRFEIDGSSGVRGICINRSIEKDDIVLKLPVDSCFTDDECPSWLHGVVQLDPHRWATRLAASWIDMYLKEKQIGEGFEKSYTSTSQASIFRGQVVWSSLLPDPEYLKASLPVHWPETTLLNARSTALELAVDSAFFARAEAVDDLVRGMQRSPYVEMFAMHGEVEMHRRMNDLAHRALDLVQTRSCRLEENFGYEDDPYCRRALAPIFDFINHGSRNTASANAYFSLEEEEGKKFLVVRSIKDIAQEEEIKIDYGASARPAWKCLLSYGFVPEYRRTTNDFEGEENLAEVYMKGVRYEVADDSVPMDMVADATPYPWVDKGDSNLQPNETLLTPDTALRIAERIADAAYYLLLEPDQILDESENQLEEDFDAITQTPFEVISEQLAASLRWSQHRILLTCAAGLTHFAKENTKEEESSYQ